MTDKQKDAIRILNRIKEPVIVGGFERFAEWGLIRHIDV